MPEAISRAVFQHLVELAALELDDAESEYLRGQLNSQLNAIRELEAIEIGDEVEITSHGVPYTGYSRPAPRPDAVTPSGAADDILAQAPELEGRFIVVPDIPHTELE